MTTTQVQSLNHTHDDHACRVGTMLAWRCSTCERIEVTDTDLALVR